MSSKLKAVRAEKTFTCEPSLHGFDISHPVRLSSSFEGSKYSVPKNEGKFVAVEKTILSVYNISDERTGWLRRYQQRREHLSTSYVPKSGSAFLKKARYDEPVLLPPSIEPQRQTRPHVALGSKAASSSLVRRKLWNHLLAQADLPALPLPSKKFDRRRTETGLSPSSTPSPLLPMRPNTAPTSSQLDVMGEVHHDHPPSFPTHPIDSPSQPSRSLLRGEHPLSSTAAPFEHRYDQHLATVSEPTQGSSSPSATPVIHSTSSNSPTSAQNYPIRPFPVGPFERSNPDRPLSAGAAGLNHPTSAGPLVHNSPNRHSSATPTSVSPNRRAKTPQRKGAGTRYPKKRQSGASEAPLWGAAVSPSVAPVVIGVSVPSIAAVTTPTDSVTDSMATAAAASDGATAPIEVSASEVPAVVDGNHSPRVDDNRAPGRETPSLGEARGTGEVESNVSLSLSPIHSNDFNVTTPALHSHAVALPPHTLEHQSPTSTPLPADEAQLFAPSTSLSPNPDPSSAPMTHTPNDDRAVAGLPTTVMLLPPTDDQSSLASAHASDHESAPPLTHSLTTATPLSPKEGHSPPPVPHQSLITAAPPLEEDDSTPVVARHVNNAPPPEEGDSTPAVMHQSPSTTTSHPAELPPSTVPHQSLCTTPASPPTEALTPPVVPHPSPTAPTSDLDHSNAASTPTPPHVPHPSPTAPSSALDHGNAASSAEADTRRGSSARGGGGGRGHARARGGSTGGRARARDPPLPSTAPPSASRRSLPTSASHTSLSSTQAQQRCTPSKTPAAATRSAAALSPAAVGGTTATDLASSPSVSATAANADTNNAPSPAVVSERATRTATDSTAASSPRTPAGKHVTFAVTASAPSVLITTRDGESLQSAVGSQCGLDEDASLGHTTTHESGGTSGHTTTHHSGHTATHHSGGTSGHTTTHHSGGTSGHTTTHHRGGTSGHTTTHHSGGTSGDAAAHTTVVGAHGAGVCDSSHTVSSQSTRSPPAIPPSPYPAHPAQCQCCLLSSSSSSSSSSTTLAAAAATSSTSDSLAAFVRAQLALVVADVLSGLAAANAKAQPGVARVHAPAAHAPLSDAGAVLLLATIEEAAESDVIAFHEDVTVEAITCQDYAIEEEKATTASEATAILECLGSETTVLERGTACSTVSSECTQALERETARSTVIPSENGVTSDEDLSSERTPAVERETAWSTDTATTSDNGIASLVRTTLSLVVVEALSKHAAYVQAQVRRSLPTVVENDEDERVPACPVGVACVSRTDNNTNSVTHTTAALVAAPNTDAAITPSDSFAPTAPEPSSEPPTMSTASEQLAATSASSANVVIEGPQAPCSPDQTIDTGLHSGASPAVDPLIDIDVSAKVAFEEPQAPCPPTHTLATAVLSETVHSLIDVPATSPPSTTNVFDKEPQRPCPPTQTIDTAVLSDAVGHLINVPTNAVFEEPQVPCPTEQTIDTAADSLLATSSIDVSQAPNSAEQATPTGQACLPAAPTITIGYVAQFPSLTGCPTEAVVRSDAQPEGPVDTTELLVTAETESADVSLALETGSTTEVPETESTGAVPLVLETENTTEFVPLGPETGSPSEVPLAESFCEEAAPETDDTIEVPLDPETHSAGLCSAGATTPAESSVFHDEDERGGVPLLDNDGCDEEGEGEEEEEEENSEEERITGGGGDAEHRQEGYARTDATLEEVLAWECGRAVRVLVRAVEATLS